jgi:hypothetical protein
MKEARVSEEEAEVWVGSSAWMDTEGRGVLHGPDLFEVFDGS